MTSYTHKTRSAYAKGVSAGLHGILAVGRYDSAPVYVRKSVGSFKTDRIARYRDTRAFSSDIRCVRRTALGK